MAWIAKQTTSIFLKTLLRKLKNTFSRPDFVGSDTVIGPDYFIVLLGMKYQSFIMNGL